jgi:hypothetical protein
MAITEFFSLKGGAGCSTIAAAYALGADRPTALVVGPGSDMHAILGVRARRVRPTAGPGEAIFDEVTSNLTLYRVRMAYEMAHLAPHLHLLDKVNGDPDRLVVVDTGTEPFAMGDDARRLAVVRNCPLHLSRFNSYQGRIDGIVLVIERGRTITVQDVEAFTGITVVATVPISVPIQRSLELGTFVHHPPSALARAVTHL